MVCALKGRYKYESFGLPLGSRMHVRLSDNDIATYYSFKPPSAHGESRCTQVPCPKEFEDNLTCWRCCNYH